MNYKTLLCIHTPCEPLILTTRGQEKHLPQLFFALYKVASMEFEVCFAGALVKGWVGRVKCVTVGGLGEVCYHNDKAWGTIKTVSTV